MNVLIYQLTDWSFDRNKFAPVNVTLADFKSVNDMANGLCLMKKALHPLYTTLFP